MPTALAFGVGLAIGAFLGSAASSVFRRLVTAQCDKGYLQTQIDQGKFWRREIVKGVAFTAGAFVAGVVPIVAFGKPALTAIKILKLTGAAIGCYVGTAATIRITHDWFFDKAFQLQKISNDNFKNFIEQFINDAKRYNCKRILVAELQNSLFFVPGFIPAPFAKGISALYFGLSSAFVVGVNWFNFKPKPKAVTSRQVQEQTQEQTPKPAPQQAQKQTPKTDRSWVPKGKDQEDINTPKKVDRTSQNSNWDEQSRRDETSFNSLE